MYLGWGLGVQIATEGKVILENPLNQGDTAAPQAGMNLFALQSWIERILNGGDKGNREPSFPSWKGQGGVVGFCKCACDVTRV